MCTKNAGFAMSSWFLGSLCFFTLCSCGGKRDTRDTDEHSTARLHPGIQSTAEFRRRLVPGMTTNQILAIFGEPLSTRNVTEALGEGGIEWRYGLSGFPADDDMRGTYVFGARIGITNGRLAGLKFDYMGMPMGGNAEAVPIGRNQARDNSKESPALKLFVVSDEPLTDGQAIDTPEFPKLGYISRNPDLVIRKLKELTLAENSLPQAENKTSTNWSFGVSLTQDDAARLAILTTSNVRRRVLITVGDVPVIAPVILAPLETGSFVIECSESSLMETVKTNLTRMEQQSN